MRRHTCEAVGCRASILPTQLFCDRHVLLLESDTRRAIEKAWNPGRPSTKRVAGLLDIARQEILFRQTRGHAMPKASSFEWE